MKDVSMLVAPLKRLSEMASINISYIAFICGQFVNKSLAAFFRESAMHSYYVAQSMIHILRHAAGISADV